MWEWGEARAARVQPRGKLRKGGLMIGVGLTQGRRATACNYLEGVVEGVVAVRVAKGTGVLGQSEGLGCTGSEVLG